MADKPKPVTLPATEVMRLLAEPLPPFLGEEYRKAWAEHIRLFDEEMTRDE